MTRQDRKDQKQYEKYTEQTEDTDICVDEDSDGLNNEKSATDCLAVEVNCVEGEHHAKTDDQEDYRSDHFPYTFLRERAPQRPLVHAN